MQPTSDMINWVIDDARYSEATLCAYQIYQVDVVFSQFFGLVPLIPVLISISRSTDVFCIASNRGVGLKHEYGTCCKLGDRQE